VHNLKIKSNCTTPLVLWGQVQFQFCIVPVRGYRQSSDLEAQGPFHYHHIIIIIIIGSLSYMVVNCRWSSCAGHRRPCLERTTVSRHVCDEFSDSRLKTRLFRLSSPTPDFLHFPWSDFFIVWRFNHFFTWFLTAFLSPSCGSCCRSCSPVVSYWQIDHMHELRLVRQTD